MTKITIILFFLAFSNADAGFFKVTNSGAIVANNAKIFSCVVDDKTQLVWEVKHSTPGLQSAKNTYTWFDGKSGVENGEYSHNCHWGGNCNTRSFINALNIEKPCKISTWRLPNEAELNTLLVYGDDDLLINPIFFPNTQPKSYWSSDQKDASIAIDVPFFYGGTPSSDKSFDAYVRAVSNAN